MEKQNDTAPARVALLIDADNFAPQYATALFGKAASYGNIIVRKAYGVESTGFPWQAETLHRYAIEPVVRFNYAKGKNVADIALVIDAMELMRLGTVDAVCIASNDSDFSLLAMKLRENGIKVYGFGDERALASFVASCDEFVRFTAHEKEKNDNSQVADIKQVRKILTDACDSLNSDDAGWINLSPVVLYLKRVNTSFSPQQYGFDKMLALVESMSDNFEVRHNKQTLTVSIRKKPAKSNKKAK